MTESSLNLETTKLADFPRIAIEMIWEQGVLVQTRLSLSSAFFCINGDSSLLKWLHAYLNGKPYSLLLSQGTSFQERVLSTLENIPFGETISYAKLAAHCQNPKAARAVGNACNRNLFPLLIPCHRVIRSDKSIGGFAMDLEIKKRLLEFEAGKNLPQ